MTWVWPSLRVAAASRKRCVVGRGIQPCDSKSFCMLMRFGEEFGIIDQIARFAQNERNASNWGTSMITMTANEAKTRFGEFLDQAQREPVRVMRHDRVVGVLVSAQDYEAMRMFFADRLRHTLAESADQAAHAGLTQAKLDALLADEG